jgi:hypothetical protein
MGYNIPILFCLLIQPVIRLSLTNPNNTIEPRRALLPVRPPRSSAARQRVAHVVWRLVYEWCHIVWIRNNATPLHTLLSDIFGGQVPPPEYGNNDWVGLDTVAWRQRVVTAWNLPQKCDIFLCCVYALDLWQLAKIRRHDLLTIWRLCNPGHSVSEWALCRSVWFKE